MTRLSPGRLLEPISTLRRTLPLLWESARGWTVLTVALMLLEIAFGLAALLLIKSLVDTMGVSLGPAASAEGLDGVVRHVGFLAAAALGLLIFRNFSRLAQEMQTMVVADHLDSLIHGRAIAADLAFYESPRYFDTLARARQLGTQRPAQVTRNLLMLAKNVVLLTAVTVLLATINLSLLPILLFAVVPSLLARMYFTRRLFRWQHAKIQAERRASYVDNLLTSDIFAKEVRVNQVGEYLRALYRSLRGDLRRQLYRITRSRTLTELSVSIVATLVFFFALGYLAVETLAGRNTLGDLALFLVIFQRAQGVGTEIVTQISRFYEDHLYIGMLFKFLDIEPEIVSPPKPVPLPAPIRTGLVIDGVSFRYPGCKPLILDDIRLELPVDGVVALVGENGSGKTSLIKLMARLYDPIEGRITLDGTDIRDFELDAYRRELSVIFQDFSRYADTVGKNIQFGEVDNLGDELRLHRAATRAGADGFIRELPAGYDTLLSRMFDQGQEISVGQWQKIALARAFFKRSRLIILDEPTSALDANAEFELFRNFRERIEGRSALVISHRLSTTRLADFIYVLDRGRIVEQGTHEELMKRKEYYHRAFSRQATNYQ